MSRLWRETIYVALYPSVVLGAETMAGASLYGSFRSGITFGSGDASASDLGSRWGIKGSTEISEGLTACYTFEGGLNTTNAEAFGGAGHSHDAVDDNDSNADNNDPAPEADGTFSSHAHAKTNKDGGKGSRLSHVSLSGGFGTVTIGQNWSASALHYGFAVDASHVNGSFGGASGRNANTISYASSAGDVGFQVDKVTGDEEALEFGATAGLGPVGVGLGYISSGADESAFTGVAISAGAAGVALTVGLGSSKNEDGIKSKTNILKVGGSLGDSGISYVVQVANSNAAEAAGDQNVISVTNSLGCGASLIFEHLDPGTGEASSLLGLRVDF